MKNNQLPEVRFPKFEDEWELFKLGEVVQRVTRKNKNLESTRPLTISAQDGLVDQSNFFKKQIASRDISGYYLVENGEFAYNKSYSNGYPWGAIKRLDLYPNGVLSTLYIVFKPMNIDSSFLVSYYDTTNWYKEVSKHAAEGARNHGLLNIAATDFFETELKVPTQFEEQVKIGSFFKTLDNTINLHKQELTVLKQTKQGFLQKMFPKDGEKVPEVRFPGFTDEWQQTELGELVNITTGKLDANAMASNGKYDFYTSGMKKYKIDKHAFEGPAITIAGNGATVGYMHYADGLFNAYQRTYVLNDFKVNRAFLYQVIAINLPKKINQEARTGNIPYIVMDMLTELKLKLPSNDEQKKIGILFNQLDDTITLRQRELEILKNTKKAFLQKMFV